MTDEAADKSTSHAEQRVDRMIEDAARIVGGQRVFRRDVGLALSSVVGASQRGSRDPLSGQRPTSLESWLTDPQELAKLTEATWICRHMAELYSEDMLRGGWVVHFDEQAALSEEDRADLSGQLAAYMEERSAVDCIQWALQDEITFGDGLAGMGIKERAARRKVTNPLAEPLDLKRVQELRYVERISRADRFRDITLEKDPEQDRYGKPKLFKVTTHGGSDVDVHWSRCLHFQSRPRYGERFGLSAYAANWGAIQLLENTVWSLGQVAYNMATRVVKSDELLGSYMEREQFMTDADALFNSLSVVLLGKGEDLTVASGSPGNMEWFVDWVWDVVSASSRIIRSRLLGSQAGALASSVSDLRRYYELIRARQESYLLWPLRQLIDVCLATDDLGQRTDLAYTVEFLPVEVLTRLERAEEAKARADVDLKRAETVAKLADGLQRLTDMGLDPALAQTFMDRLFNSDDEHPSPMDRLFEDHPEEDM